MCYDGISAIYSDYTKIITIRTANTKFWRCKEETQSKLGRHAKPKHAPVFFVLFCFFQPSASNSAQNKLAAYFVHTFRNLGIAGAILHRHTCDNTLQSAPSALICEAETCCCCRCRMWMLFSSSLAACPCGFFPLVFSFFPSPLNVHTPTRIAQGKKRIWRQPILYFFLLSPPPVWETC